MAVIAPFTNTQQCHSFFQQAITTNLTYWLNSEAITQQQTVRLDDHQDSLLRAISFGLQLPLAHHLVAELVVRLSHYIYQRGIYQRWSDIISHLLQDFPQNETKDIQLFELLFEHNRFLCRLSAYEEAYTKAQQLVNLAQKHQNKFHEAHGYAAMGTVLLHQGSYQEAGEYLVQALEFAQARNLHQLQLQATNHLVAVHIYQRNPDLAINLAKQGLQIAQQVKDTVQENYLLYNLGMLAGQQGDYTAAINAFERFMNLNKRAGNKLAAKNISDNLGLSYWYLGEYELARKHLEQALKNHQQTGAVRSQALVLANLGLPGLYNRQRQLAYTKKALALARKIDHKHIQGEALMNLGQAALQDQQLVEAERYFQQALIIWADFDLAGQIIETKAYLAKIAHDQAQSDMSTTLLDEVLTFLPQAEIGDFNDPFDLYLVCYELLQSQDTAQANQILRRAHQLLQEQAAKISDDVLKQSYLQNVPSHQKILQLISILPDII